MYIVLFSIVFKVPQSPKLKTGNRYENKFWNPGFTNGVRQFCGYQYFCFEILFYLVSSYSSFFSNLWNQIYTNVKTPKRKLGRFVNDTLLNFGLRCIHNLRTFQLGVTSFLGTKALRNANHFLKGIESLQQTQIFYSLYLRNPIT